jgi:hypothetical protein
MVRRAGGYVVAQMGLSLRVDMRVCMIVEAE